MKPGTKFTFLYLARDGRYWKIGVTNNLALREKKLRVGRFARLPSQVYIVQTWHRPAGDAHDIEMEVRAQFIHKHIWDRREYFRITRAEITAFVEERVRYWDSMAARMAA